MLLQLLVIQLVIFGLLALLLRYVLMKNINSESGHLEETMRAYAQKMEEAKQRREEAEKYYEDVTLNAKTEAEKIREQLGQQGRDLRKNILDQARIESEEIMTRAKNAADQLRQELEDKIEARAVDKAHELVERLFPGKIAEETHARWMQDLLQN